MKLKTARAQVARARTALAKANSITALCNEQEEYAGFQTQLNLIRDELNQQEGRLDLIIGVIENIENTVQGE